MTSIHFSRKFLKISGYFLGFLLVAMVAFHFWFKAHARQMIEDLVESRSNGKIRLKVEKFNFNWFSRKMEFRDALFFSTDTVTANTAYSFRVDRIKLKVDAILPIVFNKRILIDTLTLRSPEITVTRLKRSEKKEGIERKDISIPEEMGKIYNSIQDALQVLRVSRFQIDRGSFTLVNKIEENQRPIVINNIFFQIDNLQVDTTIRGAREKILFSDNVILRSHDQDILFPDERHRLSFSHFTINLQQKLVEFDSCTIAAIRTDSSSASFTMYMDALKLIDIDFDTLYKTEVIKADSVYVVNPKFNLAVELGLKKDNKPAPKLENIIKQLTGDLQLDNVVVSNADFNIHTIKNGVPSSFTFSRNNFDMQGLSIDQGAASPIKVRSFAMAIRNYENFIRDSSYSVQFDSVLFRDDRIYLSNFVFHKLQNGRIINTFNIPQFYLGGLSWDDLVFERKLTADQATLYNPTIIYVVTDKTRKRSGKENIFQSLASINEMMDLDFLDIIDGRIDLRVNQDVRIQLDKATLSIQSHNLLQSTQLAGIKNSLTAMDFRKGIIHAGSLVMKLDNIHYVGKSGHFIAGQLQVNDRQEKFSMIFNDVLVDKMLVDEKRGDIYSENISWQKGNINLKTAGSGKDMSSLLDLRNVHGRNTQVTGQLGKAFVNTHVHEIRFAALNKVPGTPLRIEGLVLTGQDLKLGQEGSSLRIGDYDLTDENASTLNNVEYMNPSPNGKTIITIPSITFLPFLESYINGRPRFQDVVIRNPKVEAELSGNRSDMISMPEIDINSIVIEQPQVNYRKTSSTGIFSIHWNEENRRGHITAKGLHNRTDKGWDLSLEKLGIVLSSFSLQTPAGKKFNTGNGSLDAEVRDIRIREQQEGLAWEAILSSLSARDIMLDSLGKKKNRLYIGKALLRELGISSASISDLQNLTRANKNFRLNGFNGEYVGENSILKWYNAEMSRTERIMGLDSLSLQSRFSRDSFMARQKLQKDFISIETGAIRLSDADIESFIRDNTVAGSELSIRYPTLSVYRDTRIPRDSTLVKPLPVNMFRAMNFPVLIDRVKITDGKVSYTEVASTGLPATVPVTNLNLDVSTVKNYDIGSTDTLQMNVSGVIFDSAAVNLQFKESYRDSLGTFVVKARFSPFRIGIFNPVAMPLGFLEISSGELDTAMLTVIANEYLAYGDMNMYYHDLKIRLLKEGETEKNKRRGFLTFLANTFVIKNKNDSRTGTIFVIRNRNRSVLNYLVKIMIKGFQSSIGVGNNRKLKRQYENELKRRNLPGIHFE